jgi:hypothetical protein
MPDRVTRESALTSETLGGLSDFAERLFWRLTIVADDAGRFIANPAVIAGRCMHWSQWLLCGLMVGVSFPRDWELATEWDVNNSPIVGGHEIYNPGYSTDQRLFGPINSWAKTIPFTWAAAAKYITQLTGSVPKEWIADNGLAPNGFDLEHLIADEQAMGA